MKLARQKYSGLPQPSGCFLAGRSANPFKRKSCPQLQICSFLYLLYF
uniref:Uncharacterized protein n=1 Tax=Mesocestoides corti TaxID=53468 RepID=A0A5K3ELD2_MESCO